LTRLGGLGPGGVITSGSGLDKFIRSALSGQEQFGVKGNPTDLYSLLNGLAGSNNLELETGVINDICQSTLPGPDAPEPYQLPNAEKILAEQGQPTAYRSALTGFRLGLANLYNATSDVFESPGGGDIMAWGTLYDDSAPLLAIFWGPPNNAEATNIANTQIGTGMSD
jgi:hypothetical protein